MKIKTSELSRLALNWAVAECEGLTNDGGVWFIGKHPFIMQDDDPEVYAPSSDWSQGGPIIEREGIALETAKRRDNKYHWHCYDYTESHYAYGETPLIAAMRCYVASKMGDEVDIPSELVED